MSKPRKKRTKKNVPLQQPPIKFYFPNDEGFWTDNPEVPKFIDATLPDGSFIKVPAKASNKTTDWQNRMHPDDLDRVEKQLLSS